jgi:dihydroorotate dehydrogenase electron transfer subunit
VVAAQDRRRAVTGPVHVAAEVIASRKAGAYRQLTLVAPGVAEAFRPGTFLAVSVGEGRLARRALWIHRVRPSGGYGATLDVVVEPVGPGTRWLAVLPVGSRLAVTGPLGRPFALPKETARCLLVGEGYAAAPLVPLAERLRERDCPVTLVIGAPDEAHLLNALEARRSAGSVTVVTADGSVGERGDLGTVASAAVDGADVVYAAGPVSLLARVARAAEEHGIRSQLAVERPLTCATGLCHGCPVPVTGDDGAEHVVRACHDGPVFRGDRVRWEAIG